MKSESINRQMLRKNSVCDYFGFEFKLFSVLVLSDLAGSSPSNNEITIPIEQPRPQSVGSYEIYHNRTERTHQVIRPRSSTINEFSPYPSVNDNNSRFVFYIIFLLITNEENSEGEEINHQEFIMAEE